MSIRNDILKKKRPRKVADLEIDEISLVDFPASRKRFAITKAADIPELGDLIQTFCGDDEIEKETPDAAALKEAVSFLEKYKLDFPPEVLSAIRTLARSAGVIAADSTAAPGDGGYPGASHVRLPGFKKGDEKWSSFSLSQIGVQIPLRITKRWDAEAEELEAAVDPDEPIPEELGPPPKGVRKSLNGQDVDDDQEESKELWPSVLI